MKKILLSLLTLFAFYCSSPLLYAQTDEAQDPYLWLEEIESETSLDWVKKQNAVSDKVLTSNPLYIELQQKYIEVFDDKEKIPYAKMEGDYVYNLWQDDIHERGLWRRMLKSDYLTNSDEWETVIDIDELSKKEGKKWVYAGSSFLKPDNKICLVYLSDGGKDEDEIREFDLSTKEFVKNGFIFPESKGGASWIDKDHVLVSRNFGKGTMTTSGYASQIKILKRGAAIDKAETIFETDTTNISVGTFSFNHNKKQHLFIYEGITTFESNLYYLKGNKPHKINFPKDAQLSGIHDDELILFLQSDWDINEKSYKKGSLISISLSENLKGNIIIKTIYEPNEISSFVSTSTSKDFIVVNTMENVQNKLLKFRLEGDKWTPESIDAPEFGSIYLVASSNDSNDYFFIYSNFIKPTTLYHVSGTDIKPLKKLKEYFNTENLVVKQYHATSKDQTKIPYFVVHHKDMKFDGNNPTMIYAYGGFGVSSQPNYNSRVGIGWLEQGGVYVLANIRGGGEFGPEWHQAAMNEKKQNSYDDFYAVSEELIAKKITSPEHLGAFGWSNGGLMAGVVFTQRPDLYNAVVSGAPLLDMKRYSKLLAGASWMGEFGNPDVPEEWEYIKEYSPYHNVSADKKYPEIFFVTSTKDDRVHPGHARKMAAKMMDMGHPLLYHETIEGGHGAASTNAQQAAMWASIYTYFNIKLKSTPLEKK